MADEQKNKDSEQSAALPALVPIPLLAAFWAVQHQAQQEQIAAATASGLAVLWRQHLPQHSPDHAGFSFFGTATS